MQVLEAFDDRQQSQCFGLVALEAADLQWEPAAVDQQPGGCQMVCVRGGS